MRIIAIIIGIAFIYSCQTKTGTPVNDNSFVTEKVVEMNPKIDIENEDSFTLIDPDMDLIKKLYDSNNYEFSFAYFYLKENYTSVSRDSIEYYEYEGEEDRICAFQESFELGIHYSIDECREEGGMGESITFPLVDTMVMKAFIQKMFEDENNTWTDDANYEADGAGCYYNVINTDTTSTISIYCGC